MSHPRLSDALQNTTNGRGSSVHIYNIKNPSGQAKCVDEKDTLTHKKKKKKTWEVDQENARDNSSSWTVAEVKRKKNKQHKKQTPPPPPENSTLQITFLSPLCKLCMSLVCSGRLIKHTNSHTCECYKRCGKKKGGGGTK